MQIRDYVENWIKSTFCFLQQIPKTMKIDKTGFYRFWWLDRWISLMVWLNLNNFKELFFPKIKYFFWRALDVVELLFHFGQIMCDRVRAFLFISFVSFVSFVRCTLYVVSFVWQYEEWNSMWCTIVCTRAIIIKNNRIKDRN